MIKCWNCILSKQYRKKVRLKRFHLNSHTTGFHIQSQKLALRTKQSIVYEGTAQYLPFEWPPTRNDFIHNLKSSLRKQPIFQWSPREGTQSDLGGTNAEVSY